MTRKLVWLLIAIFLLAGLGGCQLAREGEGTEENSPQDKFIGVYVTFEGLDGDGPLFATVKTRPDQWGEATTYEFPGKKGLSFFHPTVMGNEKIEEYTTLIASPEILEGSTHLGINGESREISLTGKIFVLQALRLFFNPVYQTDRGEVYVLPTEMGVAYTGGTSTVTYEESVALTETSGANTTEAKHHARIELTVEEAELPVDVLFKEMDSEDRVINTTVVSPDAIPDSLHWQPGCAYVLVVARSGAGGREVTRSILGVDEKIYTYKYAGENNCLVGKIIEVGKIRGE